MQRCSFGLVSANVYIFLITVMSGNSYHYIAYAFFFFFFWKEIQDPFFPKNLSHPIPSSPIFHSWRETSPLSRYRHSAIEILRFTSKRGIYKFRERLRFTDFHCFMSRLNYQHCGVQFGIAESGITPCAMAHRQARSRLTRLNRRKAA